METADGVIVASEANRLGSTFFPDLLALRCISEDASGVGAVVHVGEDVVEEESAVGEGGEVMGGVKDKSGEGVMDFR